MYEYDEECLQTFLNMQSQLFDEPVAETLEEAEAFLEDCMAVVVDSIKDVRDYLDESGADISGMSDGELEEASEVFALPNGQYLIVEGSVSYTHLDVYKRQSMETSSLVLLFRRRYMRISFSIQREA